MIGDTAVGMDRGGNLNPLPTPDSPPLPPETLPSDPDGGFVPSAQVPTGDLDMQSVPADILYQIGVLEHELGTGIDAALTGLAEWSDSVGQRIDGSVADAHAVIGGVVGSVLTRTDDATRALDGIVDRTIVALRKRLAGVSDEIRQAGVDVSYDPGVWAMMIDAPAQEWLPYIVPQIGAAVGLDDPRPPQVCPADTHVGPNGECVTDGSFPADIVCWDGSRVSNFNDCPPRPPVNPPIGPPPIPPVSPPVDPTVCPPPVCPTPPVDPGGGVCCPAPDITINVPPPIVNVTLPPPSSPPTSPPTVPPTPMPSCPDPPDVNVTIEPPPPPPDVLGNPPPADPQGTGSGGMIDWSQLDACRTLDAFIGTIAPPGPGGTSPTTAARGTLWQGVSTIANPLFALMQQSFRLVTEGLTHVSASVLAAPTVMYRAATTVAEDVIKELVGPGGGNVGPAVFFGGKLAAAAFAQSHTHFPLMYLLQSSVYSYQASNPQYIPSQAQADSLFVQGRITDEVWECWTRAHGNIPRHAANWRNSLVGKPTMDELIRLRLRDDIDEPTFYSHATSIGWSSPSWAELAWKLSIQLPTQSDIIRMMVRDAADDAVAIKYNYDKDFGSKYTGKLEYWMKSQGVPQEVARYMWRAHWVIPSNTQLYEMYHRLRWDRDEVIRWDSEALVNGPGAAEALYGPRPEVVSLADVQEALEVNDQAPYWVPKQIAIAYHPITRTDAVRAFQIGSFSDHQLNEVMKDNGYSQNDADLLTSFYKQDAGIKNANQAGVLTVRKIVRFYKDGALTRQEMIDTLQPLMNDLQRRHDLVDRTDLELRAELKQTKLKWMKRKFVHGEPMPTGWLNEIAAVTNDTVQATRLLAEWNADYALRSREVTAMQLCKWLKHRVISIDDYITRLTNLGYTFTDAVKIAKVCDDELQTALAKAAEKRAKEAAALLEKATKLADKRRERECHPPKPCWDGTPAPMPRA